MEAARPAPARAPVRRAFYGIHSKGGQADLRGQRHWQSGGTPIANAITETAAQRTGTSNQGRCARSDARTSSACDCGVQDLRRTGGRYADT